MSLYPNPAKETLNINVKFADATDVMYILTDVSGRVIKMVNSQNVNEETKSLDISNLAPGVYMLSAKTDKGTSTERFIKK